MFFSLNIWAHPHLNYRCEQIESIPISQTLNLGRMKGLATLLVFFIDIWGRPTNRSSGSHLSANYKGWLLIIF